MEVHTNRPPLQCVEKAVDGLEELFEVIFWHVLVFLVESGINTTTDDMGIGDTIHELTALCADLCLLCFCEQQQHSV